MQRGGCPCAQRLPKAILEKPEFESYFVGAESKIDQVLSSTWLKAHTKHWTWKNFIMANTPRRAPIIPLHLHHPLYPSRLRYLL